MTEEQQRASRKDWRDAEFPEACAAFDNRCAYCQKRKKLSVSRYHLAPLPVCTSCQDALTQVKAPRPVQLRIARWLENAKPYCPLPKVTHR